MDPMGIEHHPFMGFSMGFNSSHIGIFENEHASFNGSLVGFYYQ